MLISNKNAKSNKNLFNNTSEKVEQCNQCFANVGRETYQRTRGPKENSQSNVNMPENERVRNNASKLSPQQVSVEAVILIVKDLLETTAVGTDKTGLCLVSNSLPIMAFYYAIIVSTFIIIFKYPAL